ncbi:MAG: hypothetical protein D6718_07885 [Acidobacteria bacterium]|nr:MAG: hypothetical protein D6718_07885 [Acidobacteriota bacterium]
MTRDSEVDRFFDRQRREVLDRIAQRRRTRPAAWLAALAAAALLAAGAGLALLTEPPEVTTATAWLWELPLPEPDAEAGDDLLAAFGPWELAEEPPESVPLPPLFEEDPEVETDLLEAVL